MWNRISVDARVNALKIKDIYCEMYVNHESYTYTILAFNSYENQYFKLTI